MTDHLEAASGRPVAQTGLSGTPTIATEQEPARVALHLLAELLVTNADQVPGAIVQAGLRGDAAYLEAERKRLYGNRVPGEQPRARIDAAWAVDPIGSAEPVVTPDDPSVEAAQEAPLPPVRGAEEEVAPVATDPLEKPNVVTDPVEAPLGTPSSPVKPAAAKPRAKRPPKPKPTS